MLRPVSTNMIYPQFPLVKNANELLLSMNLTEQLPNGYFPEINSHTLLTPPTLLDPSLMHLTYLQNIGLSNNQLLSNFNNQLGGVKRTIQDFQPNGILGSNFSLESDQNEIKKSKLEVLTNTYPSKVLHIRNIAPRAQESDITLLAVPFGKIKTMVYAKKTNQALIELLETEEATRMFDYYTEYPPFLNGRQMIIQYSRHRSLELKLQNSNVDSSILMANRMIDEYKNKLREWSNKSERRILRVVIENLGELSVTHLVILKVFQRFGKVLRIIIFNKNNQCQCLVEMDHNISAHVALLHLNGQDLFPDCCRLRVEFSRQASESLQVQRQNDKCRDYVQTPLQEEEMMVLNLLGNNGTFGTTTSIPIGGSNGGILGFPSSSVINPEFCGFQQNPQLQPHQQRQQQQQQQQQSAVTLSTNLFPSVPPSPSLAQFELPVVHNKSTIPQDALVAYNNLYALCLMSTPSVGTSTNIQGTLSLPHPSVITDGTINPGQFLYHPNNPNPNPNPNPNSNHYHHHHHHHQHQQQQQHQYQHPGIFLDSTLLQHCAMQSSHANNNINQHSDAHEISFMANLVNQSNPMINQKFITQPMNEVSVTSDHNGIAVIDIGKKFTHNELYNLFDLYGNVKKIGLPSTEVLQHAIIYMQSKLEAEKAFQMLNNVQCHSRSGDNRIVKLKLNLLPESSFMPDDMMDCRYYISSDTNQLDNLDIQQQKKQLNRSMVSPSTSLILSQLPSYVTEQDIHRIFSENAQLKCKEVILHKEGQLLLNHPGNSELDLTTTALVSLENISEAVWAVMALHNAVIRLSSSYSFSNIGSKSSSPVTNSSSSSNSNNNKNNNSNNDNILTTNNSSSRFSTVINTTSTGTSNNITTTNTVSIPTFTHIKTTTTSPVCYADSVLLHKTTNDQPFKLQINFVKLK